MHSSWIHKALLVAVLAGLGLAVGCSSVEGKYRDSDGIVSLELKSGKASLNIGPEHLDCTYTVDGNKVIIRPTVGDTSRTIVLTLKGDSLVGLPGSLIS